VQLVQQAEKVIQKEEESKPGFLGSLLLSTKSNETRRKELTEKLQNVIQDLRTKRNAQSKADREPPQKKRKQEKIREPEEREEEESEEEQSEDEPEDVEQGEMKFSSFTFQGGKPVPAYLVHKKRNKTSKETLLRKLEQEKRIFGNHERTSKR